MNRKDLEMLLLRILAEQADLELTPERYDADLIALGLDSIVAIDIANELEAALGLVIDDREIYRFRTVNSILAYFERLAAGGQSK